MLSVFFFHYRSSYFSVKFTLKPFGCRRNDIYFDCYFDHVLQMVLIPIFFFVVKVKCGLYISFLVVLYF